MESGVKISGIGYELGERLITNKEIAEIVNQSVGEALGRELTENETKELLTNGDWIKTRTGIETRYFASKKTATSDLATKAALKAIRQSGHHVQECEFIVVATVTPDYHYSPSTAALVQEKIGFLAEFDSQLQGCLVIDAGAACSSFGAALRFGYSLIASNLFEFGVVIGADKMTTTVHPADRDFYILLGDAGAAVTLEAVPKNENSFLGEPKKFFSWSDGSKGENIIAKVGGSANPLTFGIMEEMLANRLKRPDKLWQAGHTVFKEMVRSLYSLQQPEKSIIGKALIEMGVPLNEIDIIFFHQPNLRMLEPVETKLRSGGFRGLVFNTINRFGNTTSASVPLGMAVAYEEGVLKKGDLVLICVFGGGYTAGVTFLQWKI